MQAALICEFLKAECYGRNDVFCNKQQLPNAQRQLELLNKNFPVCLEGKVSFYFIHIVL